MSRAQTCASQRAIGIVGREVEQRVLDAGRIEKIVEVPAAFKEVRVGADRRSLLLRAKERGRGRLLLSIAGEVIAIQFANFAPREFFVIPVMSCNYHTGWNPQLMVRLPHRETCGPGLSGNAFANVPLLERRLHQLGLPMTWLLDERTLRENTAFFAERVEHFFDEIAYMPPSFSHFNPVNYNTEQSEEETFELLRAGIAESERILGRKISVVGIDQFIGSVGTNFVRAAVRLGLRGLWGVGFDHETCDTSMYHRGCPWNTYRPAKGNFRIPGRDCDPIWIFQWTFRDIVNTVHVPGGASGAVMFSTDVDDILFAKIAAHQADYYDRLLAEALRSLQPCLPRSELRGGTETAGRDFADNRFVEFLVHQEDHDCFNEQGNDYYEGFFSRLPDGVTAATMGEVAAWLDLTYPYGEANPRQTLYLHDPLTCKADVEFVHASPRPPHDWLANGGRYAPMLCYYDDEVQLIYEEGSAVPFRFFDYRKGYRVGETAVYPEEALPKIAVKELERKGSGSEFVLTGVIDASGACESYPLAVWGVPASLRSAKRDGAGRQGAPRGLRGENALDLGKALVVFVPLQKGENRLHLGLPRL